MAGSVNKVILIGNVGKDPEIRTAQSGARLASFTLATGESWKDKQTGERKERTEWHNINVSNEGLVKLVERYVRKGTKLFLEGQLETRKWQDREGNDRYSTEVVLRPYKGEIMLLGGKRDDDQSDDGQYQNPAGVSSVKDLPGANQAMSCADDLDDEILF